MSLAAIASSRRSVLAPAPGAVVIVRAASNKGLKELLAGAPQNPDRRVRVPGGGRKKAEIADPELLGCLDSLIEPATRGDPESPLRWTTKSTRHLADGLTAKGHTVSYSVVGPRAAEIAHSSSFVRRTAAAAPLSFEGTRRSRANASGTCVRSAVELRSPGHPARRPLHARPRRETPHLPSFSG